MSSLRRDLIERKMWMLVAVLVVAVAAVPLLLSQGGSANGATPTPAPPPPAPATATPTAVASTTTGTMAGRRASKATKVALARMSGNPFRTATTSTTNASAATPPASSSPTSTATAPSASPTTTAMVTPSPSTSNGSGSGTPTATAVAPTPTHTTTWTSTPRTVSSAPVSTTASVTPLPATANPSWTIYSVDVRYGKDVSVRLRANLARLAPLPSASNPQVMFLGVMTGGKQAVFALKAGVGHTGPGLCRPDHTRCSAIVLKAGETEHLTIPVTAGTPAATTGASAATAPAPKQVILRVVRITRTVTHSRTAALKAYLRYSTAGLCDLALADPVLYNLGTGTVTGIPKAVCAHHPASVPFTPLMSTP